MYKFSKNSQEKISQCHQDLQTLCNHLIKYVDFTVVTGYRSPEEQLEKYNTGKSQLKVGKHNSNPSMAIDIQPYPLLRDGKKTVREQFYFLGGYAVGVGKMLKEQGLISHDIRYGGDWNKDGKIINNGFDDLYHIELV